MPLPSGRERAIQRTGHQHHAGGPPAPVGRRSTCGHLLRSPQAKALPAPEATFARAASHAEIKRVLNQIGEGSQPETESMGGVRLCKG